MKQTKVFDAVQAANAAADAINASWETTYSNASSLIRKDAIRALEIGGAVLVTYANALRAGVKGLAVISVGSMCASLVRMGEGCDKDTKLVKPVLKLLRAGKKLQDVNTEAKVPTRTKAGRKAADTKTTKADTKTTKADPVKELITQYDGLPIDSQILFAKHVFGAMVARVKDVKVRVAAAEAFSHLTKAA